MSAVTFWEIAVLLRKRRITLVMPAMEWRASLFEMGLKEIPMDGEI
ncbi:MAG: PIN domain nuclease, partial [SAR324 cluster bacterium]|nr:PIN domain nuclease [SAR324 cluster bacterium]